MNRLTLSSVVFALIFFVSFSQTGFGAKILLRENGGQFPPGEIIGINNHVVVVKSGYGNLTADFSKIDTILFDETADPNEPGIQFRNGDFVTGDIDSLKDNILTVKMKYGLYIINDTDSVKSINFLKNSDNFSYVQNKKEGLLFYLNGYESIYGNLLAIENSIMVVESKYGVLKIGTDEIEQIQFPGTAKVSGSVNSVILFKNKNRIHGKPSYFKKDEFHIRTDFGEMIITNTDAIANIMFSENKKMADTIKGNLSFSADLYIVVESAGYTKGNYARIIIDNSDVIDNGKRGFNIVAIGFDGKIVEKKHFDTYASHQESNNMASFLENISEDEIVIMAVKDEGVSSLTDAARSVLSSLGARQIYNLTYRGSYILITRKGINPENVIELIDNSENPVRFKFDFEKYIGLTR